MAGTDKMADIAAATAAVGHGAMPSGRLRWKLRADGQRVLEQQWVGPHGSIWLPIIVEVVDDG